MRRLLIVILLSLGLAAVSAQTLILPEHALGFRGGITLSTAMFTPSVTRGTMPVGMYFGLDYRLIAEKYFGLHIELGYDQRGFSTRDSDGHAFRRRMDYLDLPLMAHFTFGRRMFRFYFELGPEISVMLYDRKAGEATTLPEQSLNPARRFDWGLTGGIGIEFNTRAGIYTLAGRYSYGFGNIFADRTGSNFTQSSNQNIRITIGWMWKFKPEHGYRAYPEKPKKAKQSPKADNE